MRTLVVYESMYGNTRQIAHAIAAGLRTSIPTDVIPVSEVRDQHVLTSDLIVVGGPTHAWGMSRRRTREASAQPPKKGGPAPSVDAAALPLGIREWLRGVTPPAGTRGAAFDTRLDKPAWLTGSAAKGIGRALIAAGLAIFAQAQSFTVSGSNGPLSDGELERARQWGEDMGHRLADIGTAAPTRAA